MTELSAKAKARIARLRDHALNTYPSGIRSAHQNYCWLVGWLNNTWCGSTLHRHGLAQAAIYENLIPVIDPGELIVGKPDFLPLTAKQQEFSDKFDLARGHDALHPFNCGQASHMAVNYEKLLSLGLDGVISQIEAYRAPLDRKEPRDLEKDEFYLGCLAALRGVRCAQKIYSDHALALAKAETDPERAEELFQIADILTRVPSKPAQTFREALQSVHFLTFLLNGLYQLGRPDRYLLKYYRADIEAGRLTPADALELICCRDILDTEYIPRSLAIGYMVGGRDSKGEPVENELTHLFIESIGIVRMAYPGTGLAVHSRTSEELWALAVRQIAAGCSHPAIFNDEVITRGLIGYGLPPERACEYVQSTCVEITPCSCSASWVTYPYINLTEILLNQISDIASGKEAVPADFESFKEDYKSRLKAKIDLEAENANLDQLRRYERGGDPLVSCFVDGCLESGRDIDRGGALVNWIMPSFVGMANLCDSLITVRDMVYSGELDFAALKNALDMNFDCCEALHAKISNSLVKYGNDTDSADDLVKEMTAWIPTALAGNTTFRGDRFIPGMFCWIMHEQLGSQTGATPDGRLSGFPLGDGSGPAQGRERKGPTASILSSTKWDHTPYIGGIAVNLKFAKSSFGPRSEENLLALIKTYIARGGFQVQVNSVDAETLRDALKNPDNHRDLVVRIGGYSDYFVGLKPNMQQEILLRTEHGI